MNNLILSIDSSAHLCSVALSDYNNIIASYSLYLKNVHDKILTKNINRVLEDVGVEIENLKAVAVSAGPGSFTGLRVGISLAKALTFMNIPKLIAVSSTKIWALPLANQDKDISVMIKSHGPFYYHQSFNSKLEELIPISLENTDEFDFNKIESNLKSGEFPDNINSDNSLSRIDYLVELANQKYLNNDFVDSTAFTPKYVQNFIPKTNKKA